MAKKFDVESLVAEQYGPEARIMGNSNGTIQVELPDGVTKRVDLGAAMKSQGMDIANYDLQLNTPESAKEDNALGFIDQVELIKAGTTQQKTQLLQKKYGAENVVADSGGFKVRDKDGFWKQSDPKWYTEIAAGLPGTVAAVAGAVKGAAVGTAIAGPAGAVVGGILGGSVAATLEKYGEQKAVEVMGIRTEQDALQTADELGRDLANNLIWDTATLGAGKVLKTGMNMFSKSKVANVLGSLVHGTKVDDWLTIMRSGDDAKVIRALSEKDAVAKAANKVGEELPTTSKLASIITEHVEGAKTAAETQYARGLKALEDSGALRSTAEPIKAMRDNLAANLRELGLIDLTPMSGSIVKKSSADVARDSMVPEVPAVKKLLGLMDFVDSKAKSSSPLSAKDLLDVKKRMQGDLRLLTASMDEAARSPMAARVINQSIGQAENALNETLKNSKINIGGLSADAYLGKMNSNYSKFAGAYDVFANKIGDFKDINQVRKVAASMTTEGGHEFVQAFKQLGDATQKSGMPEALIDLQRTVAARNLASNYGGQGIQGALRSASGATGMGISGIVGAATESASAINKSMGPAIRPLVGIAKGANFLRKLPVDKRVQMMSDNAMMSQFLQGITDFAPIQEQTTQQLMQGASGQ